MTLKSVVRVNHILKSVSPQQITEVAYSTFKAETPVRSGNARNHTYKKETQIEAAYPYAVRLDNGYSRQSPQGMVKPTIDAVRRYIKKQIG